MSLLSTITKPQPSPVVITIYGDAGVGKTSLAALFPNPIFVRVEDGMQSIPDDQRPDAFPVAETAEDIFEQIKALIKEEHQYETIVVDSVTTAESRFADEVMKSDPSARSLATAHGGYGAGYGAVAAMHQRLRKGCEILRRQKGMNLVFLGHADIETMDPPDSEPYQRVGLRMNKRSLSPYVDEADVVALVRISKFVTGDGKKKKARSDGSREMVVNAGPSTIAKNRFGITDTIDLEPGENPFIGLIPYLNKE